jgi:6-phosphofructokinase 1
MKKIGILTSGGDSSGMNAVIRAATRTAFNNGIDVTGIVRGYKGLVKGEFRKLNRIDVSGIINQGGTILKTSRSEAFKTSQGRKQAYQNLKDNQIQALIVIGGDGTFRGADIFGEEFDFPVMGVPATIDNDILGTDFTVGADTAVNVALDAIDKIRDTVTSMERIFVVEVMGRDCGYIALESGVAGGCEQVVIPEIEYDVKRLTDDILQGYKQGKISWIIVVAEGGRKAQDIAQDIVTLTSLEVRVTVLGHIQRGGRPTARDRILGGRFGNSAVEFLLQGQRAKAVGIQGDKVVSLSFKETAAKRKSLNTDSYLRLIRVLT